MAVYYKGPKGHKYQQASAQEQQESKTTDDFSTFTIV